MLQRPDNKTNQSHPAGLVLLHNMAGSHSLPNEGEARRVRAWLVTGCRQKPSASHSSAYAGGCQRQCTDFVSNLSW